MAGIDENKGAETFGNFVRGAATLRIANFSNRMVDVLITDILDDWTGEQHPNFSWHNVPLSGGAFASGTLQGRFYGPTHEDFSGIFLRNQISGAFGAKR